MVPEKKSYTSDVCYKIAILNKHHMNLHYNINNRAMKPITHSNIHRCIQYRGVASFYTQVKSTISQLRE